MGVAYSLDQCFCDVAIRCVFKIDAFPVAATDPALHLVSFFSLQLWSRGFLLSAVQPGQGPKVSWLREIFHFMRRASLFFVHLFGGKYAMLCFQVFYVSDLFDSQVFV
jgi:hypothetical protein